MNTLKTFYTSLLIAFGAINFFPQASLLASREPIANSNETMDSSNGDKTTFEKIKLLVIKNQVIIISSAAVVIGVIFMGLGFYYKNSKNGGKPNDGSDSTGDESNNNNNNINNINSQGGNRNNNNINRNNNNNGQVSNVNNNNINQSPTASADDNSDSDSINNDGQGSDINNINNTNNNNNGQGNNINNINNDDIKNDNIINNDGINSDGQAGQGNNINNGDIKNDDNIINNDEINSDGQAGQGNNINNDDIKNDDNIINNDEINSDGQGNDINNDEINNDNNNNNTPNPDMVKQFKKGGKVTAVTAEATKYVESKLEKGEEITPQMFAYAIMLWATTGKNKSLIKKFKRVLTGSRSIKGSIAIKKDFLDGGLDEKGEEVEEDNEASASRKVIALDGENLNIYEYIDKKVEKPQLKKAIIARLKEIAKSVPNITNIFTKTLQHYHLEEVKKLYKQANEAEKNNEREKAKVYKDYNTFEEDEESLRAVDITEATTNTLVRALTSDSTAMQKKKVKARVFAYAVMLALEGDDSLIMLLNNKKIVKEAFDKSQKIVAGKNSNINIIEYIVEFSSGSEEIKEKAKEVAEKVVTLAQKLGKNSLKNVGDELERLQFSYYEASYEEFEAALKDESGEKFRTVLSRDLLVYVEGDLNKIKNSISSFESLLDYAIGYAIKRAVDSKDNSKQYNNYIEIFDLLISKLNRTSILAPRKDGKRRETWLILSGQHPYSKEGDYIVKGKKRVSPLEYAITDINILEKMYNRAIQLGVTSSDFFKTLSNNKYIKDNKLDNPLKKRVLEYEEFRQALEDKKGDKLRTILVRHLSVLSQEAQSKIGNHITSFDSLLDYAIGYAIKRAVDSKDNPKQYNKYVEIFDLLISKLNRNIILTPRRDGQRREMWLILSDKNGYYNEKGYGYSKAKYVSPLEYAITDINILGKLYDKATELGVTSTDFFQTLLNNKYIEKNNLTKPLESIVKNGKEEYTKFKDAFGKPTTQQRVNALKDLFTDYNIKKGFQFSSGAMSNYLGTIGATKIDDMVELMIGYAVKGIVDAGTSSALRDGKIKLLKLAVQQLPDNKDTSAASIFKVTGEEERWLLTDENHPLSRNKTVNFLNYAYKEKEVLDLLWNKAKKLGVSNKEFKKKIADGLINKQKDGIVASYRLKKKKKDEKKSDDNKNNKDDEKKNITKEPTSTPANGLNEQEKEFAEAVIDFVEHKKTGKLTKLFRSGNMKHLPEKTLAKNKAVSKNERDAKIATLKKALNQEKLIVLPSKKEVSAELYAIENENEALMKILYSQGYYQSTTSVVVNLITRIQREKDKSDILIKLLELELKKLGIKEFHTLIESSNAPILLNEGEVNSIEKVLETEKENQDKISNKIITYKNPSLNNAVTKEAKNNNNIQNEKIAFQARFRNKFHSKVDTFKPWELDKMFYPGFQEDIEKVRQQIKEDRKIGVFAYTYFLENSKMRKALLSAAQSYDLLLKNKKTTVVVNERTKNKVTQASKLHLPSNMIYGVQPAYINSTLITK